MPHAELGLTANAGHKVWDRQYKFRLRLGPLTLQQYMDFLPEGSAWSPLRAIARFFSGDETDFELQLVLKRDEVPACELNYTPQLGWSTWAKTARMPRDPDETVLRI